MFKNPLLNALLKRFPQTTWNQVSSLYTLFTLPTIGSPVSFSHKNFELKEYTTEHMPHEVLENFLNFCYPPDMPDREKEIECDQRNYWQKNITFIVYKDTRIVGCVQIVPKTATQHLPVEFASVCRENEPPSPLDLSELVPDNNITEIYRCRRSFDLNRMEAIDVLLMLYKALWAKVIQLGTAYTCISFDSSKKDLKSLYVNKIAFTDPDITIQFGSDPKKWNLLVKDWAEHERSFATISKSHFYLQTWFRSSLKKKHLHLKKPPRRKPVDATTGTGETVLCTQNIMVPNFRKNHIRTIRRRTATANRNGQAVPPPEEQTEKS